MSSISIPFLTKRFHLPLFATGLPADLLPSRIEGPNILKTTGKLSSLSSSTTLGQSASSGVSIEEVFREGRILEAPNIRVYTFAELRSSTRNFKPEFILGEGGFGKVYTGWVEEKTLNSSKSNVGTMVAVKKLNPKSVQGLEEWQSKVNFLGRLLHPNLVKLLGYCWEDKELLFVYEYMSSGIAHDIDFKRQRILFM